MFTSRYKLSVAFCITFVLVGYVSSQTALAKVLTPGEQYGGDYEMIFIDKNNLVFFYSTIDHYLFRNWDGSRTWTNETGWTDGWSDAQVVFPNTHVEKPLRYADDEYTFITDGATTKLYSLYPSAEYELTIPYEVDRVVYVYTSTYTATYILIDHSCDQSVASRCREVTKVSYLTIVNKPGTDPLKINLSDQITTTMELGVDARDPEAAQQYDDTDTLRTSFGTQRIYFLTPTDGAFYEWQYGKNDKTINQIDRLQRIIGSRPFSLVDRTGDLLVRVGTTYKLIDLATQPRRHHAFTLTHTFRTKSLHATWDQLYYYWPVTVAPHRVKVAVANFSDDPVLASFAGRFDKPIQLIELDDTYDEDHTALVYDTAAQQLRLYRRNDTDVTDTALWLELDHIDFQCPYICSAQAIMQAALGSKQSQAVLITWLDDQGQLWGNVWNTTWEKKVQLSPEGSVVTTLPTMWRVNYDEDIVLVWSDNANAVYSTIWQHQDGWLLHGQDTAVLDQADEYIPLVSTTYYYDDFRSRQKLNHYVIGESDGTISAYYVTPDEKSLQASYTNSDLISANKVNRINLYLMAFRNANGELQLENLADKFTEDF